MDRGAWQASIHGITRVRHDLVTKTPTCIKVNIKVSSGKKDLVVPDARKCLLDSTPWMTD